MRIEDIILRSIEVKNKILGDERLLTTIGKAASDCIESLKGGGRILFCGNGGSAADAQHLAAELSGRYLIDRPPLNAEALHVNSSFMTAVANDYGYEEVFARMVRASGKKGDVLVGLSTSGNSPNVIRAFEAASGLEMITIAFTGRSGGEMAGYATHLLNVPSTETPRIQESHILLGHILCELIETKMFGQE